MQYIDKVVDTVPVEVPQIQFLDRVVDVPLVMQQQVPMIQKVQKTVEISQVQFIDRVVDVPVVMQRQVLTIQKVQKTVQVPQVQWTFQLCRRHRFADFACFSVASWFFKDSQCLRAWQNYFQLFLAAIIGTQKLRDQFDPNFDILGNALVLPTTDSANSINNSSSWHPAFSHLGQELVPLPAYLDPNSLILPSQHGGCIDTGSLGPGGVDGKRKMSDTHSKQAWTMTTPSAVLFLLFPCAQSRVALPLGSPTQSQILRKTTISHARAPACGLELSQLLMPCANSSWHSQG